MPTLVKDISGVGQVACGSSHTIAVAQDGRTVWSFGGGDNGMLSDDMWDDSYTQSSVCVNCFFKFVYKMFVM